MKLVKREDHWALYNEDGHKIAATLPGCNSKLSLKNCQAIENGYDLDELACNEIGIDISVINHIDNKVIENDSVSTPIHEAGALGAGLYHRVKGFEIGFQKALEILGDKKFSEEDVISMIKKSRETGLTAEYLILTKQKTEFDVEILMGTNYRDIDCVNEGEFVTYKIVKDNEAPMLDKNNCLILKKI